MGVCNVWLINQVIRDCWPCYCTGGGHVGFVVGRDYAGQLLVLGGNQANKVSIAPFAEYRILGYRLPTGYWMDRLPLPRISLTADLSYNES